MKTSKLVKVLCVVAVVAAVAAASVKTAQAAGQNIDAWAVECMADKKFCGGYISGIVEAISITQAMNKERFGTPKTVCLPNAGIDMLAAVTAITAYQKKEPRYADEAPARMFIYVALANEFPCV